MYSQEYCPNLKYLILKLTLWSWSSYYLSVHLPLQNAIKNVNSIKTHSSEGLRFETPEIYFKNSLELWSPKRSMKTPYDILGFSTKVGAENPVSLRLKLALPFPWGFVIAHLYAPASASARSCVKRCIYDWNNSHIIIYDLILGIDRHECSPLREIYYRLKLRMGDHHWEIPITALASRIWNICQLRMQKMIYWWKMYHIII